MGSKIISLLSTLALLVAGAAVFAAPASAAGRDGSCDSGEFCYYFNSDEQGSISDFTGSVDDYGTDQPGCYDFKGNGNGKGQCIKNNAASAQNRSSKTVRVFFNSGFGGSHQDFAPGAKGQLNSTLYNQNASHQFLAGGGGGTDCKTDGTDTTLPTYIYVYRESINQVDKVAFKTYVKNVLPNEWITSWPAESLKAGAEAVKTFGWYYALHAAFKTSDGRCYDVYDNTKSQVYKPNSAVASTSNAVDATWGTRMNRSGKIFISHYCATTTACPDYTSGQWMSQNGSRDQANAGKGYQAILRSYYTGISFD